jgi:plastocyanin
VRRRPRIAARLGLVATALAALVLALSPGGAAAATVLVTIEYQSFAPFSIDALPGDQVTWTNQSARRHTVTSDAGEFDSGDLFQGDTFSQTFTTIGAHLYHCTVHRGMVGEVDVRRITLNAPPAGLVPAGADVGLVGRAADPGTPVRIEANEGAGFRMVATASPTADRSWHAHVTATKSATYRAISGRDLSETRRLLVIESGVHVRVRHGVLTVTVTPATPHASVALELYLRNRFGWWPVTRQHLDRHSTAHFKVHGPVRARVALLDRDGWTARALSPVVRVGRHKHR